MNVSERHYCRNLRCRSKLPTPIDNPHKAFCVRGCHAQFYRRRCVVCEKVLADGPSNRRLCKSARCRNEYRRFHHVYEYTSAAPGGASQSVERPQRSADKSGINVGDLRSRPWRIVAGATPSPSTLHCATVPDGSGCRWKGGDYERIDARNRRLLEAHFDKLDSTAVDHCTVCGRDDDLVDHKIADCWITTCRDCRAKSAAALAPPRDQKFQADLDAYRAQIADDLSVPPFLKRGMA
jgi:hypothetical protein